MDQKQRDEINKYLDMAKSSGIVAATNAVMQYMESEGLVYRINIKCQHIGVNENNRNGLGVDISHMGELSDNINAMGYVDHGGRICLELDSSKESDVTRHAETIVKAESFLKTWLLPKIH